MLNNNYTTNRPTLAPVLKTEAVIPSTNSGPMMQITSSPLEGSLVSIYRAPTIEHPNRCFVELSDNLYQNENIQNIGIFENVPQNPFGRKLKKNKNTSTTGMSVSSNSQAATNNAPSLKTISVNKRSYVMDLKTSQSLTTKAMIANNYYDIPRAIINMDIGTPVEDIDPEFKNSIREMYIPGQSALTGDLRDLQRQLIGTNAYGYVDYDLVIKTNGDRGIIIGAPSPNLLTEYTAVTISLRKEGQDENWRSIGTLSPGERVTFVGNGLYYFRAVWNRYGNTLINPEGISWKEYGPFVLKASTFSSKIEAVQVNDSKFSIIHDELVHDYLGWDLLNIESSVDSKKFNSSDETYENLLTVSSQDRMLNIDFRRTYGNKNAVFSSYEMPISRFYNTDLKKIASIPQVLQQEENSNQFYVEVLLKDTGGWASWDASNSFSLQSEKQKENINSSKLVPWLSISEYGTSNPKEIAFFCLAWRPFNNSYEFIDKSEALNLDVVSSDNGNILKFNVNTTTRPGAYYVFRLHSFTAGIDFVYRNGQDHLVQKEVPQSQGSVVRKMTSIWNAEHPVLLYRNRMPVEDFSQIDRKNSGSTVSKIIKSRIEETTNAENSTYTFEPFQFYKRNPKTGETESINCLAITRNWMVPSVKSRDIYSFYCSSLVDGKPSERLLGKFTSDENIKIFTILHPNEAKTLESGKIVYEIKIEALNEGQPTIKQIEANSFGTKPKVSVSPVGAFTMGLMR